MSLTAGNYLVAAKIDAQLQLFARLVCGATAGGSLIDSTAIIVDSNSSSLSFFAQLSGHLLGAVSLPAPTTIAITCMNANARYAGTVSEIVLTAARIGNITVQ